MRVIIHKANNHLPMTTSKRDDQQTTHLCKSLPLNNQLNHN